MPTGKKVAAEVYFTPPGGVMPIGGRYHAVVHLFEHRYDDTVTFWYGVADVAGIPQDSFPRRECPMVLLFSDGREGMARQVVSFYEHGPDGDYVRIAFVGIDDLKIPE